MVVAVTYKDEKVYQHFGSAPQFKFYKVEGEQIYQVIADTEGKGHDYMADFLIENDVNALICGDIGKAAFKRLQEKNIAVYAGYEDFADLCFLAYMKNNLIKATEAVCEGHEGGSCGDECGCDGDCSSCH